ncbi:MAG: NAD-dependent epimerase/dehydratase family protein [Candidatus Hadarchaeota archaeon]
MKVLVTGGCGFVGSNLVDLLMERGHSVTVLDNLSNGGRDNIKAHLKSKNFRFIKGDILGRKAEDALSGVDAVAHEAAIISVPFSIKKPELTHKINVDGTRHLLEASADAGVKRFVYASSCAVYGDQKKMPISEDAPLRPLSPYAESKLAAEKSCIGFYKRQGLSTVCLRYFNIYGPRQSGGEYAGVMIKFMERLKNNEPPIIYGDGKQTRDFVYVGDVAEATLLALECETKGGEVVNIGTGRGASINQLCDIFLTLTGNKGMKPFRWTPREGDIRHSRADISKARRLLGFRPKVGLKDGVKKLLESYGGW